VSTVTRNEFFQAIVVTALLTGATAASAAQFVLVNTDPPGVGFNDPTPAQPVGGNNGTTVGAQRLIAYNRALQQWGSILKSDVPIVVLGSFGPEECTEDGGVLASAGAYNVELNFPNAPLRDHWYHSALANSLAGYDLTASADPFEGADIQAVFNGDVGKPGCLEARTWYYGLDNGATGNQIDFLSVFMHELSHGLGFQNFIDEATGTTFEGLPNFPDSNIALTFDNATGKVWNTMKPAEIVAAATRDGQEVWIGSNVTARAPSVLAPLVDFVIASPADIAGTYDYGTSSTFGATATPDNFYGVIVPGLDAAGDAGNSINDGCSAFTNASAVAGKIAVVRRGGCFFTEKAKNAQLAGATGVIIGNNTDGIINMIGEDPTVTIPAISVTNTLGDALIDAGTAEGGLVGTPGQLAGADSAGRVRLYAPAEYSPGSSISHFDTVASPDLLMEPFINAGIPGASNVDLTAAYFEDIGWQTELSIADCGTGSGAPATTFSGVFLASPVFACANSASNFGGFQSCSTQYFNLLRNARLISEGYKGTFASCTASGK
jgi:hypothetical protein